MINMQEILKKIIIEYQNKKIDYLSRNIISNTEIDSSCYVIIGPRRSGKSYYLFEIKDKLKDKLNKKDTDFIYINFEDERLIDLKTKNLDQILEAYKEIYDNKPIIFLDEIQNIKHWEKFARRLADNKYLVFITGSNSKMLSKEIGSTLGGRYISINVNTLDFKEFLSLKQFPITKDLFYSDKQNQYKKLITEYIEFGAYPEVVKNTNKLEILKTYLDLYIYKDISGRWAIENIDYLLLILKKIRGSICTEINPNTIYEDMIKAGIPISVKTTYNYIKYLKDVFLISEIQLYKKSFKNREIKKKYYFYDNGFMKLFELEDDKGKKLQNLVYTELLKNEKEVYYWKNKKNQECDFIIKEKDTIIRAIQVTHELNDNSRNREINSLLATLNYFELNQGTIITSNQEEKIKIDNKTINVIPIWKWLIKYD